MPKHGISGTLLDACLATTSLNDMKPGWIIACLAIAVTAWAEEREAANLAEVITQRGQVLEKILDTAKMSFKQGTAGAHEVHGAAIDLYAFRRDVAKTKDEKIDWQKKVVATLKEHATMCQKRIAVGVITPTERLRAEERVLAAQQVLFELQEEK